MNLIIKNQNYKIIDTLSIDVIKTLEGEFGKEDLERNLVNLIYNKAIVDITAIKNFYDISSTLNFLSFFDPNKVIILLNNSELINANSYLSHLVERGYYNFTRNAAGIIYLMDHPNSLNDVINYTKKTIVEDNRVTYDDERPSSSSSNVNSASSTPEKITKTYGQKIIGIESLIKGAGATTLMHMMVKHLNYNYHCKGIEMLKQDALYFRDDNIVMCTGIDDLKMRIKDYRDEDVIIIDLNGFDPEGVCDDILYLIEPGVIGINKLVKGNSNVYSKVKNGKVILNRSSIKDEEIPNFEYETKFKIFYNLTNYNDRKDRLKSIDMLLIKLGFDKQGIL